MGNPYLLFTDITSVTFTGSLPASSSNPYTNLNDYNRNAQVKIPVSADFNLGIYITFDTAIDADTLIMDNIAMKDTVTLLASDDGITYSTNLGNCGVATDDTSLSFTFDSSNYQYWMVTISGENFTQQHVDIGNIFLGTRVQYENPGNKDSTNGDTEYVTNEVVTLSGNIRASQTYKGRKNYTYVFPYQTNTLADTFRTFCKSVRGKLYPFYFVDDIGGINYTKFVNDINPVVRSGYNQNEINLTVKSFDATY
jgi:hypothetical protein